MSRLKKATKKFERKHLGRTLEQRKANAKAKQLHALNEKRKKKRKGAREGGEEGDADGKDGVKEVKAAGGDKVGIKGFEEMSVEEFLEGGFQVPEMEKGKKGKKGKGEKEKGSETGAGKKRKRSADEDEDEDTDADEALEASSIGDDDVAEANGVADTSGDDGDEVAAHKNDIAALAEKDPEFYQYLKENDAELLDFDHDLLGIDELSSGGDESEEEVVKEKKKAKNAKKGGEDDKDESEEDEEDVGLKAEEVTKAHVAKWKKALVEEKSLRALRKVVLAFRAAVHVGDERDESHIFKYSITNPDVYNDLMLLGLKHIPDVLNHHLPVKESASGKVRVSTDSKNTTTLLPYLLPFRPLLKSLLKSVVEIWSTFTSTSSLPTPIDEAVRLTAFLVVRRAMVIGDDGIKEASFKLLYGGLVKSCRNTTSYTLRGINLMKNTAGETLALEGMERVGYVLGFGFIRQLAVHLRNSITNKTKDSYKTVYNWQYIHSLDFWSRALSTLCSHDTPPTSAIGPNSPYQPLIYPLVQVTLGAARLIPTPQYFPLRFHLIQSLLRISNATDTFIPLAPIIFEVFSSKEVRRRIGKGSGADGKGAKASSGSWDLDTTLRAPKSWMGTRRYQELVIEQAVELMGEFLCTWCRSVAFPELATPVIVGLKRFIKRNENGNGKAMSWVKVLVSKLEANKEVVEKEREKWGAELEVAPAKRAGPRGAGLLDGEGGANVGRVDFGSFLRDKGIEKMPLGAYVLGQRKLREERRRVLEEAVRDEGERRRRGREKDDEEESEGGFEEEEEEDEDVEMGEGSDEDEDGEETKDDEEDEDEYDDEEESE
ncbi:Noc2p family-domain-containing protein [Kalaharituber pfeilii]|nr:Noc2p family-domain-containing protein [Kalaharituber pfeilii]